MVLTHLDPCDSAAQTPDSFVWTEDAHCLYLGFLEEAFVNDLYEGRYCAHDICGSTPSLPSSSSSGGPVVDSPSWIVPQGPSPPSMSKLDQDVGINASQVGSGNKRRRQRAGITVKASSTRRKGKALSQGVGSNTQTDMCLDNLFHSLRSSEQPASSSQPFEDSEYLVPKRSRGATKRSKHGCDGRELNRAGSMGIDQVQVL